MLESRGYDFGYSSFASIKKTAKEKKNDKDMYYTVGAVKAKYLLSLST